MHTTSRFVLGLVLLGVSIPSAMAAGPSSCAGQPDGTACDDGNACTPEDVCQSQQCIAHVRFAHPAGSPIAVDPYPVLDVAADVNLDGKADLVVLNYSSHTLTVLLGDGAGGFIPSPGAKAQTDSAEQSLVVADFNVDGRPDVAVVHAFGEVSVFLGDGAGGFTPVPNPVHLAGQNTVAIEAGDFNLDAKPDVVVADLNVGTIWVLLGDGAGGFVVAPGSPVASGGAGAGPGLAVADFNLDGKPDVAVANQNSKSVSILLGDGAGGLVPAPGSPVSTDGAFDLEAGDLNLDGKPDLAVASQLHVTVLLGDGAGGFAPHAVLTSFTDNFVNVSIADFSLDGKPDIAVLNYPAAAISILVGDGLGGFVNFNDPSFAGVSTARYAALADFNLDGKPDLAVANFLASSVSIFLNDVGTAPNGTACSDGSQCTAGDACQSGSCLSGAPVDCDDHNPCTDDSCDPASGCVHSNNAAICDDGNQCTTGDVCGGGVCKGTTVPNGTACDDGDPQTSGDHCQDGVCAGSSCSGTPQPKSSGYYKKLCDHGRGTPYSGDALTDADAVCVGDLTATFAGISTVDQICTVIDNPPNGGACDKAEDELMALALNICRLRVCENQEIDSSCSGDPHDHTPTTVAASLATADATLASPSRDRDSCSNAGCLAREINDGQGMHHNSLSVDKLAGNAVRLTWLSPVMDDGTGGASSYTIWRRPMLSGVAWVELGTATGLSFVDSPPDTGSWEYDVTFTISP